MTQATADGVAARDAPPSLPARASAFARRHGRALPWVGAALAVVAALVIVLLRYLSSFESTDDAQIDGDASAIASRIAGTVVAVRVEDNQRVRQGDPLVDLDPADYRVAVRAAEANLEQARFQRLAEAEANARIAQIDLARSRRLVAAGSLAHEDLDNRQATADARNAEVDAAKAAVKAADAALEQARLNLGYTRIVAPVSGIVGEKHVGVGDYVQPGQQLLAIVRVDDLWVTANYKETQLERIHEGQRVDVRVDALGRTFHGHVESLPGASGARFALLPPENATGNYVKVVQRLPVRISLDPGQSGLERLRPGMSVEPKIWLR